MKGGPVFKYKRELFLLGVVALIVYRFPQIFYEPRMYAEEGTVFFTYAFNNPWHEMLYMPFLGYYSLLNNLICLAAAKLLPLEYAPWLTTYVSLFVYLLIFYLILYGQSVLFDGFPRKAAACLAILFLADGNIWINVISAHFYFSLIGFLILVQDVENLDVFKRWLYRILIFMAGLTGVLTCFLFPVFLIKSWRQKGRENKIHTGLLLLGCLVQGAVFLVYLHHDALGNRLGSSSFMGNLHVFYILNFLGPIFGYQVFEKYYRLITSDPSASLFIVAMSILLVVYTLFLIWLLVKCFSNKERVYGFAGFWLLSILSTIFSLGMLGGPRYSYAPNVILILLLLSFIRFKGKNGWSRVFPAMCLCCVLSCIVLGFYDFKVKLRGHLDENWPKWTEQVKRWEQNPNYSIKIWPDGWVINLKPPPK